MQVAWWIRVGKRPFWNTGGRKRLGAIPRVRWRSWGEVRQGRSLMKGWPRLEETGQMDTLILKEFQTQQGTLNAQYFLRQ